MRSERQTHAHVELVDAPHRPTGKTIRVTTPGQVIQIKNKEELEAQLKHYNKPFVSHVVPDSQFARLNYVERMRPALRYYCAKFGVQVPGWLKSDDLYLDKPDTEKMHLFGTTDIKVKEFSKLNFAKREAPGAEA